MQKRISKTTRPARARFVPASVPHEPWLIERLKDPREAAAYLEAAIEDGDQAVLMLALRHVAKAHGGVSEVARRSKLTREATYRMLSKAGNPELRSLIAILRAAGLRLSVTPIEKRAAQVKITRGSGNVFHDIGFPPGEAENLLLRAQLMSRVRDIARGMTQREAAKRFGVSQPRLNDLLRGKIGKFSLDALVSMLGHAGMRVALNVKKAAQAALFREFEKRAAQPVTGRPWLIVDDRGKPYPKRVALSGK